MLGFRFRRKLKQLQAAAGPPPDRDDRAALRGWFEQRRDLALQLFTKTELLRFLRRDARYVAENRVPE